MKNLIILVFTGIVLAATLPCLCLAQSSASYDSLLIQLKSATIDSVKVALLNDYARSLYKRGQNDSAMFYIRKSYDLAVRINYPLGKADAKTLNAMINYDLGNYSEAINEYFEVLKFLGENNLLKKKASILNNIGNSFRQQKNFEKALEYHHKALKIRQEMGDDGRVAISKFNIANLLKQEGEIERALSMYYDVVTAFKKVDDKRGLILAHNNIGNIYSSLERYDSAFAHLGLGLELANAMGDDISAAFLEGNIGDVYIALVQPEKALSHVRESMTMSKQLGLRDEIKNNYYRLSLIDSLNGNYRESLDNYKAFILYKDSLFNEETVRASTSAELRFQFHKKEIEDKLQHEKNLFQMRWRWAVVVFIMVLALAVGFGLYNVTRIKKKKEKQIFETQNRMLEMKKAAVQNQLKQAHAEIKKFVEKVDKKDELIKSITTELEKSNEDRASKEEYAEIKAKLVKLKSMHILTDEDWLAFLENFDTLYPRFSVLVREAYPKITQSEIRYLMLSKIGLGHKRMASMLGISTDAVRVTWNRVRRKLGGNQEDTPQSLLARLGIEVFN